MMDGSAVLIALGSAVCVALGWGVTSFVGSPVRKFFDLRGEVVRRLTEFANVRARYKELRDAPVTSVASERWEYLIRKLHD
jgi:hypothetical protein